MTNSILAIGQPYIAPVNVLADADGNWFSTYDADTISLSAQLEVGAGNVSGLFFGEFTADMLELHAISRIKLVYGALHTNLSGVDYASDASAVQLMVTSSGSFTVSFSSPGVGKMRWRWHPTAGTGAAPNLIRVYLAANDRPGSGR